MNAEKILEIDGSFGEGGGAILRLGAGLSVLYNRPIQIRNIRANRPKPGLRMQHLLGLKTISELTKSVLSDCKVGTEQITFIPNPKRDINTYIHVNVSTAASIGLLLQPIQIASCTFNKLEKIEISISGGGTFGKWAPSVSYLQSVSYPIFKKTGLKIEIIVNKHGWYPKGEKV